MNPDIDVLVIGGGPAGLASATRLRQLGVGLVTVLERSGVAGGIPRLCHHSPFGMREFKRVLTGVRYADRLVDAAIGAGVDIRLRHSAVGIGPDLSVAVATPDGLATVRPRRIVIATGVRETSRAARLVSGDRPSGVMNTGALQDYAVTRHLRPFRRPVIVGSELVAMSAILTCMGMGSRPAAVVEAGPRPTVRAPFAWLPKVLGIPVHLQTRVKEIIGTHTVSGVVLARDGHPDLRVECDGVIFTGGFTPEASLAQLSGIAIDRHTGGPVVDQRGQTSVPGVFAAGNVLRGVETSGWAWDEGQRVARSVFYDLNNEDLGFESVPVGVGEGIRLAMPQRLLAGPVAEAFPSIQVRLDKHAKGMLVVERNGRRIWSTPVAAGAEQRLLIPIGELNLMASPLPLQITLRTGARARD